jgi:hypothetical protein
MKHLTHAQRSQLRKRAAQVSAAAPAASSMAGANVYEVHLAQLAQDRLRLKQIQSGQGKAELKRQLLPAYAPYVDGVLAEGRGAQDEVLTTVMVWRIDAEDFGGALDVAEYVLKHGMTLPDRFARTTGCLIAEEIATAALKAQKVGASFDREILLRTAGITREQDMPDEARAKLYLALGKAALADVADDVPADAVESARENLKAAQDWLQQAIELHSNCGGKKDLERVERLLKKYAAPAAD